MLFTLICKLELVVWHLSLPLMKSLKNTVQTMLSMCYHSFKLRKIDRLMLRLLLFYV